MNQQGVGGGEAALKLPLAVQHFHRDQSIQTISWRSLFFSSFFSSADFFLWPWFTVTQHCHLPHPSLVCLYTAAAEDLGVKTVIRIPPSDASFSKLALLKWQACIRTVCVCVCVCVCAPRWGSSLPQSVYGRLTGIFHLAWPYECICVFFFFCFFLSVFTHQGTYTYLTAYLCTSFLWLCMSACLFVWLCARLSGGG